MSWDDVVLQEPHDKQRQFRESRAKRKVIRGGRRGGKTSGLAQLASDYFMAGKRVLYATPTAEQIGRFWTEITRAFAAPIDRGLLKKNESEHFIELPRTEQRIRAKTAWNANTLRGDYADLLILDEWQLMNEDAWGEVGAPMLLDNNGDAVFCYTPPSMRSRSTSKARDRRHAPKLYKRAEADTTGRWAAFHFTSHDNPHISAEALAELASDMTKLAIRQEIEAEDVVEVPGSIWKLEDIEKARLLRIPEGLDLLRVGVGVDPSGGATECGIVVAGVGLCACKGPIEEHAFVLEDATRDGVVPPAVWAGAAVTAYHGRKADRILGERNYGGDMVEHTIRTADKSVSYKDVIATRGKAVRAEPVSALYEQGKVHHVGTFDKLEDEQCGWVPESGQRSPNRMDALVWVITWAMLEKDKIEWRLV